MDDKSSGNIGQKRLKSLENLKEKYELELLLKTNVIGVGISTKIKDRINTNEPCIFALVNSKSEPKNILSENLIPAEIEGVLTDVVEIGTDMTPSGSSAGDPERVKRWRPVPAGVSVGHYRLNLNGKPASGTLGGWVKDNETGEILMMSCWHVLANCGNCKKGDPIVQPGPADGGRHPRDTIGYLERWVDVKMMGVDLIEAKRNLKNILRNKSEPHFNLVDTTIRPTISLSKP